MKRTSVVGSMKVNSLQFSCAIFIGDNLMIDPRSRIIAVQREIPKFLGDEGNFNDYKVFQRKIPVGNQETDVEMTVRNESPYIHVNRLRVVAMAVSAVVQVGSTVVLDSEARQKQFRQMLSGDVIENPASPEVVERTFALSEIVAEQALNDP